MKCILIMPNFKRVIINRISNIPKMYSVLGIAYYRVSSAVMRKDWNYNEEEYMCYPVTASDYIDINDLFNPSKAPLVDKSLQDNDI